MSFSQLLEEASNEHAIELVVKHMFGIAEYGTRNGLTFYQKLQFLQLIQQKEFADTVVYPKLADIMSRIEVISAVPVKSPATKTTESSVPTDFSEAASSHHISHRFVPGSRLGSVMLYTNEEKQLYRKKKAPPGRVSSKNRYTCRIKSCPSVVYLEGERVFKLRSFKEHKHTVQEDLVIKNEFEDGVKRLCKEKFMCPSNAFEEAMRNNPTAAQHSSLPKMRRTLDRIKNKTQTGMPQNKEMDRSAFGKLEVPLLKSPVPASSALQAIAISASSVPTSYNAVVDTSKDIPHSFVPGNHLGSVLLYTNNEKQLYIKKKTPPGRVSSKIRYACRVKGCPAAVYLEGERVFRLHSFKEHTHTEQQDLAIKNAFEDGVKRLCKQGNMRVSNVFLQALQNNPTAARHSSLPKMRRTLDRLKKKVVKNLSHGSNFGDQVNI